MADPMKELGRIVGAMNQLAHFELHVGVIGAAASAQHEGAEAGVTVADVATWNYFGTSTIPARPFIAIAFQRHKDQLTNINGRIVRGVMEGKIDARQGYELAGQNAVAVIQETIATSVPPPNAASTIEKKGSSTTLIDSGQLRQSVSFEIR